MNVKPGDMAKFVNCENAGAVCTVIGRPMFDDNGCDWEVLVLQSVSAVDQESGQTACAYAGQHVLTWDQFLRRIDLDADDETPEPQQVAPGIAA